MTKGRAKPIHVKPAERDTLGKQIDSWPETAWTDSKKEWVLDLFRVDGGYREEKKFEGTYAEMDKLRKEYMVTGLYYKCVAKFGMPVGNERDWKWR